MFRLLIICCLSLSITLLADSTVVKDTVAVADSSEADTLEVQNAVPMQPIDKVLQCVTEEGKRLNILMGFLLKRLEAAEAELDTTAIDSVGGLSLGRTDSTRGQDSSQ